jgi:hypothetical protein
VSMASGNAATRAAAADRVAMSRRVRTAAQQMTVMIATGSAPTATTPTTPRHAQPRRCRCVRPSRGDGVAGKTSCRVGPGPRLGLEICLDPSAATSTHRRIAIVGTRINMSCTGGGNATHPPPADKVQSETDRHEGDASWLAEHSLNIGVGHG